MTKRNEFVVELLSEVLSVMEEYGMEPKIITVRFDIPVGFATPYNAFSIDFEAIGPPEVKP